jgi:hypothetical protein
MAITLKRQLTPEEKNIILQRHGRICFATGHAIPEAESLHYDHIKAFTLGGQSELDNIAPMCEFHNKAKGMLPLEDFRIRLQLLEFFATGDRLTLKNLLRFMKERDQIKNYGGGCVLTPNSGKVTLDSAHGKFTYDLLTCPTTGWKYFYATFKGSFGLTVECPLAVTPVLPMDHNEPLVPTERQVFERVANGLVTLRESIANDSIDPLLAGYLTGFSANMCRKLAEIYEKADGRRIEYDISWSPQLKSACEHVWKPMVFDGRAYEFARIAAGELEKAETFTDSLIEGRVVVLKSEMPPGLDEQAEFEHIITMFWEREKGQTVKIRVSLSPDQYKQACDAHKEGRAIRILGVPEKAGKFWTLTKAHDFTVVN